MVECRCLSGVDDAMATIAIAVVGFLVGGLEVVVCVVCWVVSIEYVVWWNVVVTSSGYMCED